MNAHDNRPEVLVGYDGTPCARGAVRFAAAEAVLRRALLRVVHVRRYGPGVPDPALADVADFLRDSGSWARASFEVALGQTVDALVERCGEADLLVVGRGAVGRLGLGSVAAEIVTRSPCAVAVVPDDGHAYRTARGDVVVGVDPAGCNDAALELAFEEALSRRTDLVAAQACPHDVPEGQGVDTWAKPATAAPVAAAGRRMHEDVHAAHARYPAVPVTELLREGRPTAVLLETAETACLVVIGSRGHGHVTGRVVGSVGQHLLRHTHCPVLVAPAPAAAPALKPARGRPCRTVSELAS